MATNKPITIKVKTAYLDNQSNPLQKRYVFTYTITIENHSDIAAQLISRHWVITDANDDVQEVRGEGVVGEQPVIEPGGSFRYTSGATLPTPVGCMEGSYFMIVAGDERDATDFEVPIPAFSLHTPTALN